MDGWVDECVNGLMGRWMMRGWMTDNGLMDRWIDEWMDEGLMDRWIDEWMDG